MPNRYGLDPVSVGGLEWLVREASLDALARDLRLELDGTTTDAALQTTKRFFEEAHPTVDLSDCRTSEASKILIRREFVLALTEVLCDEINAATERWAPIDIEIGVTFQGMIQPGSDAANTESARLGAIDPLRWTYQALDELGHPYGTQGPTDRELALIRVERIKDVMVGSETALGGPAKLRSLVLAICALNRAGV